MGWADMEGHGTTSPAPHSVRFRFCRIVFRYDDHTKYKFAAFFSLLPSFPFLSYLAFPPSPTAVLSVTRRLLRSALEDEISFDF
jgi:hypothetical protein